MSTILKVQPSEKKVFKVVFYEKRKHFKPFMNCMNLLEFIFEVSKCILPELLEIVLK